MAGKQEKLAEVEGRMAQPDFWDRREAAQATVAEMRSLKSVTDPFAKVVGTVEDFEVLAEMAAEDEDMLDEADSTWATLSDELDKLELASFLSGRMARNNAIVSVNAGAGGTESCDWAAMLYRMFTHWCDRRGFTYNIIDMQAGDEAGYKSATIMVTGEFAYGYLKGERGIHRLVRISPFDANKRRHTSFAAVDVVPEIDDDIEVEVNDSDLRVDTYRASGAGGQHVNKTDSAVRFTHVPTGIVVTCQNERSQHKNRSTAMKILKARLYELEESKRDAERAAEYGQKSDNAWGNQIRSYVLQPYQMVKDLRTNAETSNVSAVLDGDIDLFIEAYLRHKK
ncbi:MAG: peptide chain release factor 2 [Victivallales bacterium]|nr:peptide chain release factor 2 [Victivallales bacterium]MBT7299956.1 peptide chain release factor 2 [Victivallales bacterium]